MLRVGDRLRFVCPQAPEACVERAVGPDGTVDLPGIGPLSAATRRLSELARSVTTRLPLGLDLPRVEVRFLGPAAGEVGIGGAVRAPLRLYAPRGIAAERLYAAAGLLDEADRTLLPKVARLRPGTGVEVPVVAADRRISVLGAVGSPRSFPPTDGLALASALEAAGGLTAHGDRDGIVVVRGGESIPVALPADGGFLLRPGDLVRVGLVAARRYVVVRGLVVRPGSVEYAPGMTAMRALAAAGGPTDAAKDGSLVWGTGAKTYRLSLRFLREGRIPDPVLGANDTLTVEAGRP